jgi:acetoin utilization deacetylase AcuC-like enzyme
MLKVSFRDEFVYPLPESHRFPMEKYDLLVRQLQYEGTILQSNIFSPTEIELVHLSNSHCADYVERLMKLEISPREQRKSGFEHSRELISREFMIMEGTRKCAEYAIQNQIAMNIAGGTHHAFRDRGEGFCLLNDFAIAAYWLVNNNLASRILIVDLDVHQGNGTAAIFENEPDVFTFSMHGEFNYPLLKEKSSLDVGLKDGTTDKEYLYLLQSSIDRILKDFIPDFILYQCGVDVLASDKLGRLNLSIQGCKERDRIVFSLAKELKIPIICAMGGGYSPDIKVIIEAHANTFRLAQSIFF